MTAPAPAGWYPDPTGISDQRWWNGTAWTADVPPATATPAGAGPTPHSGNSIAPPARRTATAGSPNKYAIFTFGVVAIYVFITLKSHVVILGVLPLGLALRSQQAREPMAPLAIGAAAIAIVLAVILLTGN